MKFQVRGMVRWRQVVQPVLVFSFFISGCSLGLVRPVASERQGFFDRIFSASADSESDSQSGLKSDSSEDEDEAPARERFLIGNQVKKRHRFWPLLNPDPPHPVSAAYTDSIARELRNFHWPLQNIHISSPFGKRGGVFHEGVDLRARVGTPVYASQSGLVLYSSRVRGYGKLIVLRHYGNLATLYAHNSKLLVPRGTYVRKGQLIARSGKSGHTTGPHLHFEVIHGSTAMDPVAWIQKTAEKRRVTKS